MFIFRVWQARHTSKHSRPPEVHPSLKGHYITTDHITVRITWGCSAGLDRNFAWRFFLRRDWRELKKKERERKEAHWRGEEQITRKRKRAKNPSSHGCSGLVQSCGSLCAHSDGLRDQLWWCHCDGQFIPDRWQSTRTAGSVVVSRCPDSPSHPHRLRKKYEKYRFRGHF